MADERSPGLVERIWDGMQWTQFLFASVAVVVLGGVLFVRPEPIPDFPYRPLVAAGCCGFGGLMLFAFFFGTTSLGKRVKCLLVSCPMALMALGGWAGVGQPAVDVWRLTTDGVATNAVVIGRRFVRLQDSTRTTVDIEYDGHRGRLFRGGSRGDVIPVLYSASHPANVMQGQTGESFLELLLRKTGGWLPALGFAALFLLMAGSTLLYLWAGLFGSTEGMVD